MKTIPEIIEMCLQAAEEREKSFLTVEHCILYVTLGIEKEKAMEATKAILLCFMSADMIYEMRY